MVCYTLVIMKHFNNNEILDLAKNDLRESRALITKITTGYGVLLFLILALPAGEYIYWIIQGPLLLSSIIIYLRFIRKENHSSKEAFDGFKNSIAASAIFLLTAGFSLLWSLLLIIPGIVAALSYSQALYLLADNPSLRPLEAINKSKEMMNGYKWQYFLLLWSFLRWPVLLFIMASISFVMFYLFAFLVIIPISLAFLAWSLWFIPYLLTAQAHFYEKLRASKQ